jgi:hypothetical protein
VCIISRRQPRAQKNCKQLRDRQSSPHFAPSSFLCPQKNTRTQVPMNDGNLGCKARSHRSYLLTACTTAFAGRAEMRSSEAGGTVEQAASAGVKLKQAGANTTIHAASMSIIAQHTGDVPYSTLHQGTCLTMCGLYRPSILLNQRLAAKYPDPVVCRWSKGLACRRKNVGAMYVP